MGILTEWCELNNIPYTSVPVGTIKKFATGKGNAPKSAMIEAVYMKWGVVTDSDDEADAVALFQYKLSES